MTDKTLAALVGLVISVAILLVFGAASLGYVTIVTGILSVCLAAVSEAGGGR